MQSIKNTQARNEIQKVTARIAHSAPKFRAGTPGDEYWRGFEDLCTSHSLSSQEAVALLANLINEHPHGYLWFETVVKPIRDHITMASLKEVFFDQFLSKFWKKERFQELIDLSFRPQEDVRSFVNRFMVKLRYNELAWAEATAEILHVTSCSLSAPQRTQSNRR